MRRLRDVGALPASALHGVRTRGTRLPRDRSTGTLYSFTVARQATAPHFRSQVPQVIAIVELSNGVHVTTVLLADQAGSVPGSTAATASDPLGSGLAAGAALEPVFLDGDDGITLLH